MIVPSSFSSVAGLQTGLAADPQEHSHLYREALDLSDDDLEFIQEYLQPDIRFCGVEYLARHGFLSFFVRDKLFILFSQSCKVKGTIVAFCLSDPTLNSEAKNPGLLKNSVPEQWQKDIAGNLRGKRYDLHAHIKAIKERNSRLWQDMQLHSRGICRALGLDAEDLNALMQCDGPFLSCRVDGKDFAFKVKNSCGAPYGGQWESLIHVTCTNDSNLNENTGCRLPSDESKTTYLTVVSQEWHKKILQCISEGNFDKQLRGHLDDKAKHLELVWKNACSLSSELCEQLECTKKKLKYIKNKIQPSRSEGFCSLDVNNKLFTLFVEDTNGYLFNKKSRYFVQAFCTNDKALNVTINQNNTFVNMIPEVWHTALLDKVKTDQMGERIHAKIAATKEKNEQIYQRVARYSQDLCAKLQKTPLQFYDFVKDIGEECCLRLTVRDKIIEVYLSYLKREHVIMAICRNDDSLNETTSDGKVSVLTEEWHKKILNELVTKDLLG